MKLIKSIKRNIELGSLALSLLKAKSANDEQEKQIALRAIAGRMASLNGLPQKIGQILSLHDLNSENSTSNIFDNLTDGGNQVPFEKVSSWIEKSLGQKLQDIFLSVDHKGQAASIGQVHRAFLKKDPLHPVAVKAQYPEIASAINNDLYILGLLAQPIKGKARSTAEIDFDLSAYRSELRESLHRETDYQAELGALTRAMARWSIDRDHIETPKPIPEFCRSDILTMSWIDGEPFKALLNKPVQIRQRAADLLLTFFLKSWLEHGEIHADPHCGNYRFRIEGDNVILGVLDFGCMMQLTPPVQQALRHFVFTPSPAPSGDLFNIFHDLGFNPTLMEPLRSKLPELHQELTAPFQAKGLFNVRNWNISENLAIILGDDRWNFRVAGPASLILFVRALSGTMQQLSALNVDIDWAEILSSIKGKEAQAASVNNNPAGNLGTENKLYKSNSLKISVTESGLNKVSLTLPVSAIEDLSELVPPEVLTKLAQRQINLQEISAEALDNQCPPMEIFNLIDGGKSIRVWLEE